MCRDKKKKSATKNIQKCQREMTTNNPHKYQKKTTTKNLLNHKMRSTNPKSSTTSSINSASSSYNQIKTYMKFNRNVAGNNFRELTK